MDNNNQSNQNSGLKVAAVVAAFVIGAGIAYPIGHSMADDNKDNSKNAMVSAASTDTKAAKLRVTLDGLLREHVTTNLAVTYNIIDKVPETKMQASLDAQTANAVAIANAVGGIYGDEAKQAVAEPFVDHLMQSNNYAKAVLAGDTNAEQTSLAALQADLRKVADAFNSVIPSVSSDTLYTALNEHETLMNEVAAAYQAGDFQKAYQLEDQALTQISGGAQALAGGIVASKPNDFK